MSHRNPAPANRDIALGVATPPGVPTYLSPVLRDVSVGEAELPFRPVKLRQGGVIRLIYSTRHQIQALHATPAEARAARLRMGVTLASAVVGMIAVLASGIGSGEVRAAVAMAYYCAVIPLGQASVSRSLLAALRRHLALGGQLQGRLGHYAEDLPELMARGSLLAAYVVIMFILGFSHD